MTIPRKRVPSGQGPAFDAVPTADKSRRGARQSSAAAFELVRFGPPAYVADLDGNIVYVNARYRQLAAAVAGRPVGDSEAIAPMFDIGEAVARVIAGAEEVRLRESLDVDGTVRVYHSSHFPIPGEDGAIEAVGGIYEDATAESADWKELHRTKERYEDITRLSYDMIWETDASFALTYVSPRVTEVLGMHPRELEGVNLFALGAMEGGEETLTPERRSPFRNQAIAVTHRNGKIKQLRISGLPIFSEAGAFMGYRGTATDVSAETEARESANLSRDRLSTAIENISEGFALYDSHNRLVLCNSRFREYLAGAQRVMFPGAPFHGILQAMAERGLIRAPDDGLEAWLGLRHRAESMGEAAIELHLSSGRWMRITDRPTGGGGIASIVSDITETKEREETLRAAKELAEQGSRSKSEFLANMSHELRTPLNAIIGFSEIMRAETLGPVGSPRYIEYLDDIIDSSQHLLGVINDILDVAKSEAGKLELNEESVDLTNEIRLTGRLFAEQAGEAEVALSIEVPDTLVPLWADQRKVRQILLNLVSNAVKFTPPGGRVTVSAAVEKEGTMAITVEDTGIGIRKEDLPAALAPFGQVESSLSRRYEGTGLGLPLTRALVERHGGELLLDSEPGRGTRVTARFPRKRVMA